MNKHMQLPVDIHLVRNPGQAVLSLAFRRAALEEWCLSLCLLKEGLIETLSISDGNTKVALELRVTPTPEIEKTALASFARDKNQVEITHASLDYLQHFFLKYYRDGLADVNHIDLQAVDKGTGDKNLYITFKVPDSKPAVSGDEAERRLRN